MLKKLAMRNRLSKDDAFRLIFSQSQQKETDKNHTHTQQFLQNILKFAFINHLAKHFSNNYAPFLDACDTILSARLMIVVVLDIVARRGAAKIITPENGSIFTICLGHSANVTPSDFYSPLNCPRFSVFCQANTQKIWERIWAIQ